MNMSTKIAILEDDQAIAEMYKLKFEAEGYDVSLAENGKIGLEVIERIKPAIILLDLMMPEMTGEEVLQALRKTDWGKDIKVIILTNVSRDEATIDLRALHVNDYIIKAHYTPQQVIEAVKKVLEQ